MLTSQTIPEAHLAERRDIREQELRLLQAEEAVRRNQPAALRQLIAELPFTDTLFRGAEQMMTLALRLGHAEVLVVLLSWCEPFRSGSAAFRTSLHCHSSSESAASGGRCRYPPDHERCVKLLLAAGAPLEALDCAPSGNTPLERALAAGHLQCAHMLLEAAGQSLGPSRPLPVTDDAAFIELALRLGADPNQPSRFDGVPPLLGKARFSAAATRALLQGGADVGQRSLSGDAAFVVACSGFSEPGVVAALVAAGADLECRSANDGRTPLTNLVRSTGPHWRGVLEVLLDAGANPLAADAAGNVPLFCCRSRDQFETIIDHPNADLIEAIACKPHLALSLLALKGRADLLRVYARPDKDVNTLELWGLAPIHWAALRGHEDVVLGLLEVYPFANKDSLLQQLGQATEGDDEVNEARKRAAAAAAAARGKQQLLVLGAKAAPKLPLIEVDKLSAGGGHDDDYDVDPAAYPSTAMTLACRFDRVDIVTHLITKGLASRNASDAAGNTPLHVSARFDARQCLALLVRHDASLVRVNHRNLTAVATSLVYRNFEWLQQLLRTMLITVQPHLDSKTPVNYEFVWVIADEFSDLPLHILLDPSRYVPGHVIEEPPMGLLGDVARATAHLTHVLYEIEQERVRGDASSAFDANLKLMPLLHTKAPDRHGILTPNYLGLTPLHLAAKYRFVHVVRRLLQCLRKEHTLIEDHRIKPSIDHYDRFGNTPLHYAAMAGDEEIVGMLLDFGANPLLRNYEELSPFNELRCSLRASPPLPPDAPAEEIARRNELEMTLTAVRRNTQRRIKRLVNERAERERGRSSTREYMMEGGAEQAAIDDPDPLFLYQTELLDFVPPPKQDPPFRFLYEVKRRLGDLGLGGALLPDAEVQTLSEQVGIDLPTAVREYYRLVGARSDGLSLLPGTRNGLADVRALQKATKLEHRVAGRLRPGDRRCPLPPDALVLADEEGIAMYFVLASDGANGPLYVSHSRRREFDVFWPHLASGLLCAVEQIWLRLATAQLAQLPRFPVFDLPRATERSLLSGLGPSEPGCVGTYGHCRRALASLQAVRAAAWVWEMRRPDDTLVDEACWLAALVLRTLLERDRPRDPLPRADLVVEELVPAQWGRVPYDAMFRHPETSEVPLLPASTANARNGGGPVDGRGALHALAGAPPPPRMAKADSARTAFYARTERRDGGSDPLVEELLAAFRATGEAEAVGTVTSETKPAPPPRSAGEARAEELAAGRSVRPPQYAQLPELWTCVPGSIPRQAEELAMYVAAPSRPGTSSRPGTGESGLSGFWQQRRSVAATAAAAKAPEAWYAPFFAATTEEDGASADGSADGSAGAEEEGEAEGDPPPVRKIFWSALALRVEGGAKLTARDLDRRLEELRARADELLRIALEPRPVSLDKASVTREAPSRRAAPVDTLGVFDDEPYLRPLDEDLSEEAVAAVAVAAVRALEVALRDIPLSSSSVEDDGGGGGGVFEPNRYDDLWSMLPPAAAAYAAGNARAGLCAGLTSCGFPLVAEAYYAGESVESVSCKNRLRFWRRWLGCTFDSVRCFPSMGLAELCNHPTPELNIEA